MLSMAGTREANGDEIGPRLRGGRWAVVQKEGADRGFFE